MMSAEKAIEKREAMLRDGYVLIENILPESLLEELRAETERLIANHVEAPELRYQGQHIDEFAVDNPVIDRLLTWKPAYEALAAMGFGDFKPEGKVIILTKEGGRAAALLAPGLGLLERPAEPRPLAAGRGPQLLFDRHQRGKRLPQGHPRQPPQALSPARPDRARP